MFQPTLVKFAMINWRRNLSRYDWFSATNIFRSAKKLSTSALSLSQLQHKLYSLPMATHQTKTNITRLRPKPSLINSSLPTRGSQGVNKRLQGPLRRSARLLDKTSHIHEQTRSKDGNAERKPPFPSPTSGSPVKKA
jgi:hypothetical protein